MNTKRQTQTFSWVFWAALAGLVVGCGSVAPTTSESASATVVEENLTYTVDGQTFDGFLAYPEGATAAPAVIVAHDFLGLGDNATSVARRLAGEGYVAWAVDFYGQDRRPANVEEANAMALAVREDVVGTRAIMQAAWRFLLTRPEVDAERVTVLGYSVGGVAALELARSGASVAGVVGLWPILENARPQDAQKIDAPVLILVGTLDPLTPPATVDAFETELQTAETPVSVVRLDGVAHAFTVPAVGSDVSTGFAFDADADAIAWRQLLDFLTAL